MRQSILVVLILVLVGLIAWDTVRSVTESASGSHASAAGRTPTADETLPQAAADPRRASRLLLRRDAAQTYLDSLLLSTDSLVRRWPDEAAQRLRIAIVEGGSEDYTPELAGHVRDAAARWERAGVGLWFTFVTDTAAAHVVVRWQQSFEHLQRAGQTDLTWNRRGDLRRAAVVLAIRNDDGQRLPETALLGVAVHELGHAIGLPHSWDPRDVMFPTTMTADISPRDRATATLLYRLPPGSVKEIP